MSKDFPDTSGFSIRAPEGTLYMNIQTGEIMPVEEFFSKT